MFPISDVIPSRTRPVVTVAVIAATAATFLYQWQLDAVEMQALARTFGAVPLHLVWSGLATSALLHDGWIHFGGNMLYLWIFGDNVEDALGHWGFALFYAAAAIVSAGAHVLLNPDSAAPLIGASGAVAAVMGAYFVLYPRSQVLTGVFLLIYLDVIEVPAVVFLALWLLLQLVAGAASMLSNVEGGTAFAAHVAGFAAGAAVGGVLRLRGGTRPWTDPTTPARGY